MWPLTLALILATSADCLAQQSLARTELYEEQLLMSALQLDQQKVQLAIQDLQLERQLAPRGSAQAQSLDKAQETLLRRLQDDMVQFQHLQARLQQRLWQQTPSTAFIFRPPPSNEITRRQTSAASNLPGNRLPPPAFQSQQRPNFSASRQQTPAFGNAASARPRPVQQVSSQNGQCSTRRGQIGTCIPLDQCLTFYADVNELRRQPCPLGQQGRFGVCCPPRDVNFVQRGGVSEAGVLRPPAPPIVTIIHISSGQLDDAGRRAIEASQARKELAAQLFAAGIFVRPGTAAAGHQEFFQTTNDTLKRGEQAQVNVDASVSLVQDLHLTPEQGTFALPQFSVLNTVIADTCPPQIDCQVSTKYRTADGSCNNLQDGRWGRTGTALQRILPPKYGDGVNSPRVGADGTPLPSPRLVSRALNSGSAPTQGESTEDNLTLAVMQWGQFLDHDLTHTPISKGPTQSGIACCVNGRTVSEDSKHPDCFPIELPAQDPVFSSLGEHCMEFVRSLPAPRPQCNFGPREQQNQISGYLDSSNVYGSTERAQRDLRLFRGGLLRAQRSSRNRQLLPEHSAECTDESSQLSCFKAGDGRVNEQIQLTLMHTIWLREHNRVASALSRMHPRWSDEALFQEARRIVIAEMQHITYAEWLPIVLGKEAMEKLRLLPTEKGSTRLYDDTLNAGITNVFATAAFRFGHSLIRDTIQGFSHFGAVRENLLLHRNQFSPFVLYMDGAIDDFIRGLLTQSCGRFDRFFSEEITDKLFQGELPFGLDLVALNIQRGRDHGLPPYNDWREVCGLPRAATWDQLSEHFDGQAVQAMRDVYHNVEEIDLFPALVSERPKQGSLVGPTLSCLLSDQFARLKRGDRFFYEEEGQAGSFTPEQITELKKTSLARILCDNADDVIRIQPRAFLKSTLNNQRIECSNERALPRVNLAAWARETPRA